MGASRAAVDAGAMVMNHTAVRSIVTERGVVRGVELECAITGRVVRVSVASNGAQGTGQADGNGIAAISRDGGRVPILELLLLLRERGGVLGGRGGLRGGGRGRAQNKI